MTRRQLVGVWCGAVAAGALALYALVLVLGGGAPPPAPPGLPDTGRVAAWLGGFASLAALVLGVVAVGLGLIAGGLLGEARPHLRQQTVLAAAAWVTCTLVQIVLLAWELGDRANLFDTDRGKALLVQLGAALVAAVVWAVGRRRASANVALDLALIALLPVVVTGHARAASQPVLAGIAVSAHVVGAALWVGGLAALGWLAVTGSDWRNALPRYSRLALVCVVVVIASGLVAGIPELDSPGDLLTSSYGAVMTLKVVFLAGLVVAGRMQRAYVVERRAATGVRAFVAIAGFELTAMALTMALAAALTRTPPPS